MSLILMNNKKDKIITNSKKRLSDLVDVKASPSQVLCTIFHKRVLVLIEETACWNVVSKFHIILFLNKE